MPKLFVDHAREPALVWAVVPLKSPAHAKTRMARALSPAQRRYLLFELAERIIRALHATRGIDAVAVITASSEVAAFARSLGAQPIPQPGETGTASAFAAAVQWLLPLQPRQLLMIAADLPLVSSAVLQRLIAAGDEAADAVVVPDRHRIGTNALLCRPPQVLTPCFGNDSFRRHLAAADLAGIRARVLQIDELALDLDSPEDLDELRRRGGAPALSLFEALHRLDSETAELAPRPCAALME